MPFDLTPTDDEQQLAAVARDFAAARLRPAAAEADETGGPAADLLAAGREIGFGLLGVPEDLGGLGTGTTGMAPALVAEALGHGDMGLAVALLAHGAVATAVARWGSPEQRDRLLPALVDGTSRGALALNEPTVLFDAMRPATTATRVDGQLVLDGEKSLVPVGGDATVFVVGVVLDGCPALVVVERSTSGVEVDPEPAMGVRACATARLRMTGAEVPVGSVLGSIDGSTYAECVRLSRLAWCAVGVGTGQAVLDHVIPYVNQREAFGEPISHRQSVAFMVADLAIELEAMRLLTYRAAARAARGEDVARDVALARTLCAEKGMRIGLDGVQLLGGHGFVKEHPVERWYRDLRALGVMEGGLLV